MKETKTKSQTNVNKFINLLQHSKTKQINNYIDRIVDDDFDAQQTVEKALQQCFIDKNTTPQGILNALKVYLNLVLKSAFDYIQSEEFSQKIHLFLYRTCEYDNQLPVNNKGKRYCIDVLKVEQNEQNEQLGNKIICLALQIVQNMAQWYPVDYFTQKQSRYVIYINKLTKKNTKFLQKQHFEFFKQGDQKIFNENHKQWFLKIENNYQQQNQRQNNTNKNKSSNVPSKIPQSKIDLKYSNTTSKQAQSLIHFQQQLITSKNPQSKINVNQSNFENSNLPNNNTARNKGTTSQTTRKTVVPIQKGPQFIKQQQQSPPKFILQQKNTRNTSTKKKQVIPPQFNEPKDVIPSEQSKRSQNSNSQALKPQAFSFTQKQINNNKNNNKNNNSNHNSTHNSNHNNNSNDINNNNIQTSYFNNPTQQIPKVIQQSTDTPHINSNRKSIKSSRINIDKLQLPTNQNLIKYHRLQKKQQHIFYPPSRSQSPHLNQIKKQMEKKKDYQQQEKRLQDKANQLIKKNHQSQSSSKIKQNSGSRYQTPQQQSPTVRVQPKMEKPVPNLQLNNNYNYQPNIPSKQKNKTFSSQQPKSQPTRPNTQHRTQQNYHPKMLLNYQQNGKQQMIKDDKITKNRNSTPKIQKKTINSTPKIQKKNNIIVNLFNPHSLTSFQNKQGKSHKTLSNFRSKKKKGKDFQPFIDIPPNQRSQQILQIVDKTRLGELVIPFVPQYFLPAELGMQALILQSLRTGVMTTHQTSKPFYKNEQILYRLIKTQSFYILSIENRSKSSIQICYSQAMQLRYGNQFSSHIKIKQLQKINVEQIIKYHVGRNQFIDIHFNFHTSHPNFKFLTFVLVINTQVHALTLPITLLDQGTLEPDLHIDQINSYINLYGRIYKSPPINLSLRDVHQNYQNLPNFFGKTKSKNGKLFGFMTYSIQISPSTVVKVSIYIKHLSQKSNQFEIHALYDNRLQDNQNYSKVLVELLCFLLCQRR